MMDVGGPKLFACDECPIVMQLEGRLLDSIEYPEYGPFQFDHCSCDKVDGEFFAGGYCEDAWLDPHSTPKPSRRKHGRAYRREMTEKKKQRLLALARSGQSYRFWVEWDFVNEVWMPVGKYIERHKNSRKTTYCKNYSNRVIRHGGQVGSGKGGYKKAFAYWWTID